MTLMEKVVWMLKACGFTVYTGKNIEGFDIDIYGDYDIEGRPDDYRVVFEFLKKDTQQALLDTILVGKDYKSKIKADMMIIVVVGLGYIGENREVAKRFDIKLWSDKQVEEYFQRLKEDRQDGVNFMMDKLKLGSYTDPDNDFTMPKAHG